MVTQLRKSTTNTTNSNGLRGQMVAVQQAEDTRVGSVLGIVDGCIERGLAESGESLERMVRAISFASWPAGSVRNLMTAVLKYAPDAERERLACAARGELGAHPEGAAVAISATNRERLEGGSREAGAQRLAGGPVDMFDRELIGIVCAKGGELGCGLELYEMNVAELDRQDRATLWAALEPVADITCGHGIVNGQPGNVVTHPELEHLGAELRSVCERLDCTEIADAFLLNQDAYYDIHVEGGSARVHAVDAADRDRRFSDALNRLSPNPKALAALEGLLSVLVESAPAEAAP